jgi:hypothetical protein
MQAWIKLLALMKNEKQVSMKLKIRSRDGMRGMWRIDCRQIPVAALWQALHEHHEIGLEIMNIGDEVVARRWSRSTV